MHKQTHLNVESIAVNVISHAKPSDRPKWRHNKLNETVLHNKLEFCFKEQKVPASNHFSTDYGMHTYFRQQNKFAYCTDFPFTHSLTLLNISFFSSLKYPFPIQWAIVLYCSHRCATNDECACACVFVCVSVKSQFHSNMSMHNNANRICFRLHSAKHVYVYAFVRAYSGEKVFFPLNAVALVHRCDQESAFQIDKICTLAWHRDFPNLHGLFMLL